MKLKSSTATSSSSFLTKDFSAVISAFERSLIRLNKMPRIWLLYVQFTTTFETKITATRRIFDRALQSLPVNQHQHIWPLYIS